MKTVLRCLKCGTTYPPDLVARWGRSAAADGLGPTPVCPGLVTAATMPEFRDPADGQMKRPEELCRGMLAALQVADSTEVEDIGAFGGTTPRSYYPGQWRQESRQPDNPDSGGSR